MPPSARPATMGPTRRRVYAEGGGTGSSTALGSPGAAGLGRRAGLKAKAQGASRAGPVDEVRHFPPHPAPLPSRGASPRPRAPGGAGARRHLPVPPRSPKPGALTSAPRPRRAPVPDAQWTVEWESFDRDAAAAPGGGDPAGAVAAGATPTTGSGQQGGAPARKEAGKGKAGKGKPAGAGSGGSGSDWSWGWADLPTKAVHSVAKMIDDIEASATAPAKGATSPGPEVGLGGAGLDVLGSVGRVALGVASVVDSVVDGSIEEVTRLVRRTPPKGAAAAKMRRGGSPRAGDACRPPAAGPGPDPASDKENARRRAPLKAVRKAPAPEAGGAAALRRQLKDATQREEKLRSAHRDLEADARHFRHKCAALSKENEFLRAKATMAEEQDPLAEQMMRQLQALLAEKQKLACENARLQSENESLHELLAYTRATSEAEAAEGRRDVGYATPPPARPACSFLDGIPMSLEEAGLGERETADEEEAEDGPGAVDEAAEGGATPHGAAAGAAALDAATDDEDLDSWIEDAPAEAEGAEASSPEQEAAEEAEWLATEESG